MEITAVSSRFQTPEKKVRKTGTGKNNWEYAREVACMEFW